jgi:integrase
MKQRITQKLLAETKPASKDIYISDTGLTGFRLKITPAGKKVLFYQFRNQLGKQRKLTFNTLRVDEARRLATSASFHVRQRRDPLSERDAVRASPSLQQAFDLFLAEHLEVRCKPNTWREYKRVFVRYVPADMRSKPLATIRTSDVLHALKNCRQTPIQANRLLAVLSSMFSWCMGDGQLHSENPARSIKRFSERKRSFVFEPHQLNDLGRVLQDAEEREWAPAIYAIKTLLLTGMRKNEVLQLRRNEVNLERRQIHLRSSKTGARVVTIGDGAAEILALALRHPLAETFVFPSSRDPSKPIVNLQKFWNRVRAAANLRDVRIHDLRHNFGGVGAATTRSAVHVKGLLGHTQLATTDRYMKLASEPLVQAANSVSNAILSSMRNRPTEHSNG